MTEQEPVEKLPEPVLEEHLQPIYQRFMEQLSGIDEAVLLVLKGHLLIEERLTKILETFVFHPKYLEQTNLRFAQKVALARSLSLDEPPNRMWDLIISINSLRNELAHALDSPKRQAKMDSVRQLFFELVKNHTALEEIETCGEQYVLTAAVGLSLGFLASFEQEAVRFRSFVDAMDRVVNPHRHAGARESDLTKPD